MSLFVFGQSKKYKKIISEGKDAKNGFLSTDKGMGKIFDACYRYVNLHYYE